MVRIKMVISKEVVWMVSKYAPKKGLILDVGCGDFAYTKLIKKTNDNVVSLDIEINEKNYSKETHFVIGVIEKLPFKNEYFDFIVCLSVIELIEDDSSVFKELYRVLKSNGRLLITIPTLRSPFRLLRELELKFGIYAYPEFNVSFYHYYTKKDILKLSEHFKLLDIYGYQYNFFPRLIKLIVDLTKINLFLNNVRDRLIFLKTIFWNTNSEGLHCSKEISEKCDDMPLLFKIGHERDILMDLSYHYIVVLEKNT